MHDKKPWILDANTLLLRHSVCTLWMLSILLGSRQSLLSLKATDGNRHYALRRVIGRPLLPLLSLLTCLHPQAPPPQRLPRVKYLDTHPRKLILSPFSQTTRLSLFLSSLDS